MVNSIKGKEIKSILFDILLIALAVFLMLRPLEIVSTLIKVMGIFILVCGVFDFINYFFNKDDGVFFNYGLFRGIMEITVGILFVFKYNLLITLFPSLLGLMIVFINIFKLQTAIEYKKVENSNYMTGIIISSLSIILGIIVLINPFETVEVVVIVSGAILLVSEISNIIYSASVLRFIKRTEKVVKDVIVNE